MTERIIVVGASAGGVEALRDLVAGLPRDLPAAVCVVLHVPPYTASSLPAILTNAGPLPAEHASDGMKIRAAHIYVAPPDHHLLIDRGTLAVTKGPKENRFRPSIDALFRSAAYVYESSVIGVVLSGALDDGTSGLWSIKRLGGTTVVQQPEQSRFESMPRTALESVDVDYTVPSTEMGSLLARLAHDRLSAAAAPDSALESRMAAETEIAAKAGAFQRGIMKFGELTPYTCPECHGALVRIREGHAYTASALLEGVMEESGELLWQVMRSLEEAVLLLDDMGRQLERAGASERAKEFYARARDIQKRSETYHADVLRHESLSGDNVGQD